MPEFTLQDIIHIMRENVGADESVDFDTDISNTTYEELGYDSLAVMEIMSCVEQNFGMRIDEEVTTDLKTPGETVTYVNKILTAVV